MRAGFLAFAALVIGPVSPLQAQSIADRDDALRRIVAEYSDPDRPGLAVAVVRGGELITATAGLADLESREPITENTRFNIASVSKQFTGLAIAMLESEGRIDVSASVSRYLPELEAIGDSVTVRHLLDHSSGIKDYHGLLALAAIRRGSRQTAPDIVRLIASDGELRHAPGDMFLYSNSGYLLLAEIVHRVSGLSLGEWLERHVFQPAGMTRTGLSTGVSGRLSDEANAYTGDGEAGYRIAPQLTSIPGPSGVRSSARDLGRWAQVLLERTLLPAAVHDCMRTGSELNDGSPAPYGFGLELGSHDGVRRIGHGGSAPGWQSYFFVYPDEGIAVVLLSNGGASASVGREIADVYLAGATRTGEPEPGRPSGGIFIDSEPYEPPPESSGVAGDTASYASFAGRYRMEGGLQLIVTTESDRLFLTFDGEGPAVELFPVPGARYRWMPGNWDLSFRAPPNGPPTLTVHLTEHSIHRGEPRDMIGARVEDPAPTLEELAMFEGCYRNVGLDATYRVRIEAGRLVLSNVRIGSMPLTHHRDDTYRIESRGLNRLWFLHEQEQDLTSPVAGIRIRADSFGVMADFPRCAGG